jgi:hypothetical protein
MKILKALGVQVITNILPFDGEKNTSAVHGDKSSNKEVAYG